MRIVSKRRIAKFAKGIKLIKRKIVQVYAKIKEKYNKVFLEFDPRFKFGWVFGLEFG